MHAAGSGSGGLLFWGHWQVTKIAEANTHVWLLGSRSFFEVGTKSKPSFSAREGGFVNGLGKAGKSPKANLHFRLEKGDLLLGGGGELASHQKQTRILGSRKGICSLGLGGLDCHEKQTPSLRSKKGAV